MTAGRVEPAFGFGALDAGIAQSYPFKLQTILAARYSAQTVSVFNAGIAGKNAWEDRSRLASSIFEASPELVLLMEGANDLNSIVPPGINAGINATVAAMEDMVRDTLGRNIPVIVATLPPQRAGGSRAHGVEFLPKYNTDLKTMTAKKGAALVDVNAQFPLSLIGQDGLHPTEPGYQTMAEIFLEAIKTRYEVAPITAPTASR